MNIDDIRLRLAKTESGLPYLSVLGLLSGLAAGLVIVAFRVVIESLQGAFLPGGLPENYEALPGLAVFLLPAVGGLIIGLIFHWSGKTRRNVGPVHVMERLIYYQGHLPLSNAVLQFVGAALSIISGHSVGREGPAVHLGAATGSLLGQYLSLPNNSIRTLVACGTAAAIAASFNTPLAGVIFAMEVIMLEYTIVGFIPVILAAVSATTLIQAVYGNQPVFNVPPVAMASAAELAWVTVMGIVVGVLAAAFIVLMKQISILSNGWPTWSRMTLGGVLVGLCALAMPEVMGIGYDTVNGALLGGLSMGLLVGVALMKLLATALGLGLGLPGGLIGPTLVIGAAAGAATGFAADGLLPMETAQPAFYALLGMAAMMAATLQAPLAALMAMLELAGNPNIILPGMLAVITSSLTASQLFGQTSVFVTLLRIRGMDYKQGPVAQYLRRAGVASIMDRDFVIADDEQSRVAIDQLLGRKPRWVLVRKEGTISYLMPAADVERAMHETDEQVINLLDIPAKRMNATPVHVQASLQEAFELLQNDQVESLFVERTRLNSPPFVYGIITRDAIDSYRAGG